MKNKLKEIIKKILIVASLVVSIGLILTFVNDRPTFADSGFSTSHSSSHSSSSHSSSHSSSSRRSRSSSSSSSGRPLTLGESIVALSIYLIFFIIVFAIVKKSNLTKIRQDFAINVDDTAIENQIKQYIPTFNKEEFLNNCYNMYCDIQVAWMNFKLEDVKDMLTDELYSMYESQLATLEVKGEQNIMKDFVLKKSFLKNVQVQNDTITIATGYIIEFYDYIANKETGEPIRGESKHKMRVTYEMSFRQTLDANKKVDKCPSCGAEVEVNSSGICPYCRSKLVTENTKWVLTEKKALSQNYI